MGNDVSLALFCASLTGARLRQLQDSFSAMLDLMFRHILSYMSKFTRILFHLAVLCDSLRCGAYGTYCYGIS